MNYTLSDFDYHLPEELIAQSPAHPRDHARLLIYDREDRSITDDHFYNLGKYLHPKTRLVVNNSKVEKCRLLFDDGKRELFITSVRNDTTVEALVRPGKKFKLGREVELANGVTAKVTHIADDGLRTLVLSHDLDAPKWIQAISKEELKLKAFETWRKLNDDEFKMTISVFSLCKRRDPSFIV